ncbi:hypothetical protein SprV_0401513000 [Sparganum proliferum]
MSQLVIPDGILRNPILSARISRYLSRKDRLNCKSLIPTWDLLTTRILGLTPDVCSGQVQLFDILQNAPQGVEIVTLNFADRRGVGVVQILSALSGPGGTGLINLTTLDIMKQPINLEQLGMLLAECPMPRLRNLSLTVVAFDYGPRIIQCLKTELKLQEVAIRFIGVMKPCELLLLIQSFGDLRSLSLDDSQISRYWTNVGRRDWESCQTRIPQWTSLQIHHKSDLLDLFLGESRSDYELSELTLSTEPGHFFPKRACVSAKDRCNMPSLQCPSTDTVHDDEAPVNFVAFSLMTVEDNCLIHPTNLHDLCIHIRPPGTSSSTTVTNSSPSLASSPGNDVHKGKYIEEMPSLARDCFLPIIEKCGPNLQSLEVSAELITACCSNVLTTRRLLRLQDKCLNVRKATVIAGRDLVERQLRPSAENISTYLGLFPALKEVTIGFSMDENVQERELIVGFRLHCELDVRENRVQDIMEFLDHLPLNDNEGIIDISTPKFRLIGRENEGLYFLENCLCHEARERRSHWRSLDLLVGRVFKGKVRLQAESQQLDEMSRFLTSRPSRRTDSRAAR